MLSCLGIHFAKMSHFGMYISTCETLNFKQHPNHSAPPLGLEGLGSAMIARAGCATLFMIRMLGAINLCNIHCDLELLTALGYSGAKVNEPVASKWPAPAKTFYETAVPPHGTWRAQGPPTVSPGAGWRYPPSNNLLALLGKPLRSWLDAGR